MTTWNDVFVERLFNNSVFDNGVFRLPEGYGRAENYARVIGLFRMLYDISYRLVLEKDVGNLWKVQNETGTMKSTGSSPEDAIDRFLKFYEPK